MAPLGKASLEVLGRAETQDARAEVETRQKGGGSHPFLQQAPLPQAPCSLCAQAQPTFQQMFPDCPPTAGYGTDPIDATRLVLDLGPVALAMRGWEAKGLECVGWAVAQRLLLPGGGAAA